MTELLATEAPTETCPPTPIPPSDGPPNPPPPTRKDGWTPQAQRTFMEALAASGVVRQACEAAGMSHEAAYSLRQRAGGAAFRMGWDAALLLARARIVDDLMTRAIQGQVDVLTRNPDIHEVRRARHDNRLGLGMLTRLDRQCSVNDAEHAPHRMIAQDWEAFLDLIERGLAGSGLALFLASRNQDDAALAEMLGNGRCQLRLDGDEKEPDEIDVPATPTELAADMEVWFDDELQSLRTNFPPPKDFYGDENERFGEDYYHRELTSEEQLAYEAMRKVNVEPLRIAGNAARDAYFGFAAEEPRKSSENSNDNNSEEKEWGQFNQTVPAAEASTEPEEWGQLEQTVPAPEPEPDPAEFTAEGIRIFYPGTRDFTEEYQRSACFRVVKPQPQDTSWPPPWAERVW